VIIHLGFRFLGIGTAIGIGIDVRSFHVIAALLAMSIAIRNPIWTLPTQEWAPCLDLFYRSLYNLQAR